MEMDFLWLLFWCLSDTVKHTGEPVAVGSHLSHDLAVNFIAQFFMLCGWTKDLVGQLYGTADMFDGVVAHVLQDG